MHNREQHDYFGFHYCGKWCAINVTWRRLYYLVYFYLWFDSDEDNMHEYICKKSDNRCAL